MAPGGRRRGPNAPEPIARETTDRLVSGFLEAVRDVGEAEPAHASDLIGELSSRLTGTKRKGQALDWLKYLISVGVALAAAYFGLKLAIQTNATELEQTAIELEQHKERRMHDGAERKFFAGDERLRSIERKTDQIEIRQGVMIEGIEDIKGELKEQRLRRLR